MTVIGGQKNNFSSGSILELVTTCHIRFVIKLLWTKLISLNLTDLGLKTLRYFT